MYRKCLQVQRYALYARLIKDMSCFQCLPHVGACVDAIYIYIRVCAKLYDYSIVLDTFSASSMHKKLLFSVLTAAILL